MPSLHWAVAAILAAMWILALALNVTLGGFIHVLLALAIIAIPARAIERRWTT